MSSKFSRLTRWPYSPKAWKSRQPDTSKEEEEARQRAEEEEAARRRLVAEEEAAKRKKEEVRDAAIKANATELLAILVGLAAKQVRRAPA